MILDDARGTKYCPDCRQDLPLADFTKNARMRDGLSFYCRPCRIAREETSRRKRLGPRKKRIRPADLVVPDGSKWCPKCGEVKSLELFPRNRRAPSGFNTYCKPCHNKMGYASREKHGGNRNYHLRRRYGITAEHFDAMSAAQGGLCAICRVAPAGHVDHDHATGRVRGLLCFNCNGALGQLRDRADLLLRAVAYLNGTPAGTFVGDLTSPRPADEPWSEGFAA